MKKILVLGAGKSSIYLIDYLVENASAMDWFVLVADLKREWAEAKTKARDLTEAIQIDLANETHLAALIKDAALVVSMLPAAFHVQIAKLCLKEKRNLLTPSYISDEMKLLHEQAIQNGLLFMNELGLDPGIDHMSAFQIFEKIKRVGGQIKSFKSHCGGLVAKKSDNNPWHYKFSWNPRNVILAGQGATGIKWKEKNEIKEINYEQLFEHSYPIQLSDTEVYETYPNRDSLKYIEEYHLHEAETVYRGTLRVPPFCKAWNWLVKNQVTALEPIRYNELLQAVSAIQDTQIQQLISFVEFENTLPNENELSAAYLQRILETKWQMQSTDSDLVVMIHEVEFEVENERKKIVSSLVLEGKDNEHTAMAMTVGLPLAFAAKMILTNQLNLSGVCLPNMPEVYNPIMTELEKVGVKFHEQEINLSV